MAYFPNGSAGAVLDEQCENCPLDEKACPTLLVHWEFNYEQVDPEQKKLRSALSMLVNDDGECQTRKLLLEEDGS